MAETTGSESPSVTATLERIDSLRNILSFDPAHPTSQAILQAVSDHVELAKQDAPAHAYAAEAWLLGLMVVGRAQDGGSDSDAEHAFEVGKAVTDAANQGWVGTTRELVVQMSEIAFPESVRQEARKRVNQAASGVRAAQAAWSNYDPDWPEPRLKTFIETLGNAEGLLRNGRPDRALELANAMLEDVGDLTSRGGDRNESLLPTPQEEEEDPPDAE